MSKGTRESNKNKKEMEGMEMKTGKEMRKKRERKGKKMKDRKKVMITMTKKEGKNTNEEN